MTGRARAGVLVVCAAVVVLVAWYAGTSVPPSTPAAPTGSVRLGPEPGEDVAAYLARLPAELPAPGAQVLALVQLGAELPVSDAVAVVNGVTPPVTPTAVVLHVPLPRVQTALRFEALDPGVPAATAVATARERAQMQAAAEESRRTGRARDVAATEAAALTDPAAPCVVAFVVRADRRGLEALAASPEVRAVHAAPVGSAERELALAPLLPAQVLRADPVPDDGTVTPP
jgi:hypothetical protein